MHTDTQAHIHIDIEIYRQLFSDNFNVSASHADCFFVVCAVIIVIMNTTTTTTTTTNNNNNNNNNNNKNANNNKITAGLKTCVGQFWQRTNIMATSGT